MDEMTELIYNITMEHLAVQQRILTPELAMPRIRRLLEEYGQKMFDRGVTSSLGSSMTDDVTPDPMTVLDGPFTTIKNLIDSFKPDPVTGLCTCRSCVEKSDGGLDGA